MLLEFESVPVRFGLDLSCHSDAQVLCLGAGLRAQGPCPDQAPVTLLLGVVVLRAHVPPGQFHELVSHDSPPCA